MSLLNRRLCFSFLVIFCTGIYFPKIASAAEEPLFVSMDDSKYNHVRVTDVISTDMIVLETDDTVKLIGLKSLPVPETGKVERDQYGFVVKHVVPYDTLEEKAINFVRHLILNKYVRLEFDELKRGQHNILFAYVYLDDSGLFVNQEILKQGYASLSLSAPNMKYADQLRKAYQTARQEKRGINGE